MLLEQLHHPQPAHLLFVVEGHKLELSRVLGDIFEGSLDGIEIMCANGGIFPGSAEGVMQLLLGSDEGLVCLVGEGNVSQNSRSNERTDLFHLSQGNLTEGSTVIDVDGAVNLIEGAST